MIRFHQTFGAHTGRVHELDQDVITFGRLPECDVSFDPRADLDASGRHAEVRREGGGWHVVDVGSRNGTWVNAQRVQRATLTTGDEIEFGLGGPRLKVEILDTAHADGRHVTGPMTPARPGQATAPATAVPPGSRGVDASAPTLVAESQPPPRGEHGTPVPVSRPPGPMGGWTPPPPTPIHGHAQQSFPAVHTPGSSPGVARSSPPAGEWDSQPSTAPGQGQGAPKYGQKTVAMMIQSAVDQSRQRKAEGGNRSTAFLKAIATEAATTSSRGLRIAVAVLAFLLLVAVGVLVAVLLLGQEQAEEARRRDQQLQQQVARGPAGARIASAYNGSIYLLVERMPDGQQAGLCTAFAVRPDLLATNAHCVVAMERRQGLGAVYLALPNGARGEGVPILQMWRHPGYLPDAEHPSADVGILQIQGTVPVQVALASMEQVQQMRMGDDIFVYGFPGDLANVTSPVATITNGVIGRMVAWDGSGADFQGAQLIQHSAFTSPGTSGSPIFNQEGVVVAVNAGTFRTAQQQQVVGPLGPHAQTVVTESGYKYGVRIDLLTSLLAGMNR